MLRLALRIGDLLAQENEKGRFTPRLDSDWDTHMWLEAYRLLEPDLGDEQRARWKSAILQNVALVVPDAAERVDFPWYNSPFIGTSPNHYAQYAALLLLAGLTFGNKEWEDLGTKILHRFAAEEQAPDGYWGEHSRSGPTTGYDHLTMTQVALYWEYSRDPAALRALRRSTDFHEYFTYANGRPVEVINDRNRYWDVDAWGHFGFSHFADGRRYAEFLTSTSFGKFLVVFSALCYCNRHAESRTCNGFECRDGVHFATFGSIALHTSGLGLACPYCVGRGFQAV
jgi:hypothetical protein